MSAYREALPDLVEMGFSDGGYVNWRTREAERTFGVSFEARF